MFIESLLNVRYRLNSSNSVENINNRCNLLTMLETKWDIRINNSLLPLSIAIVSLFLFSSEETLAWIRANISNTLLGFWQSYVWRMESMQSIIPYWKVSYKLYKLLISQSILIEHLWITPVFLKYVEKFYQHEH